MFRIVSLIMTVLFVVGVVVQFNDPDGFRWMIVYGFAVVVSVMALFGRYSSLAVVGVVGYLGAFFFLMPSTFDGWYTNELAREALGMLFCAIWMIVLSVKMFRDLQELEREAAESSPANEPTPGP